MMIPGRAELVIFPSKHQLLRVTIAEDVQFAFVMRVLQFAKLVRIQSREQRKLLLKIQAPMAYEYATRVYVENVLADLYKPKCWNL